MEALAFGLGLCTSPLSGASASMKVGGAVLETLQCMREMLGLKPTLRCELHGAGALEWAQAFSAVLDVVSYMAQGALEGMSALRCELHGAGALEWAQAFPLPLLSL
jgi:hypothetical protein